MESAETDNGTRSTIYRIDGDDRFVYVNAEWHRFAAQNDASPALNKILGKSIWDYISGRETGELYRMLLQRVRTFSATVEFEFRCDSPTVRRYMRMTILPRRFRQISFVCVIQNEVAKVPPLPLASELQGRIKICSLCNKIQVNEEWLEVEDAVNASGLMSSAALPGLTYGVCTSCHDNARSLLHGP